MSSQTIFSSHTYHLNIRVLGFLEVSVCTYLALTVCAFLQVKTDQISSSSLGGKNIKDCLLIFHCQRHSPNLPFSLCKYCQEYPIAHGGTLIEFICCWERVRVTRFSSAIHIEHNFTGTGQLQGRFNSIVNIT